MPKTQETTSKRLEIAELFASAGLPQTGFAAAPHCVNAATAHDLIAAIEADRPVIPNSHASALSGALLEI